MSITTSYAYGMSSVQICVYGASGRQRERENCFSPFSQHGFMRTRLGQKVAICGFRGFRSPLLSLYSEAHKGSCPKPCKGDVMRVTTARQLQPLCHNHVRERGGPCSGLCSFLSARCERLPACSFMHQPIIKRSWSTRHLCTPARLRTRTQRLSSPTGFVHSFRGLAFRGRTGAYGFGSTPRRSC